MVPARLTVITLGARDLAALRSFYLGLGWSLAVDVEEEIAAFQLQGAVLSLFGLDDLAADGHVAAVPPAEGIRFSLAINVDEPQHVDQTIAAVKKAGGRVTKEPVDTHFGGRSAYFADPEDNFWEVVWVPPDSLMAAAVRRASGAG